METLASPLTVLSENNFERMNRDGRKTVEWLLWVNVNVRFERSTPHFIGNGISVYESFEIKINRLRW